MDRLISFRDLPFYRQRTFWRSGRTVRPFDLLTPATARTAKLVQIMKHSQTSIQTPWASKVAACARNAIFVLLTLAGPPSPASDTPAFGFQDFLLVPVRIHLLSSEENPSLHTTLTGTDVERIFQKANRVWAPAGIQFFVESLICEPAAETKNERAPEALRRAPIGLAVMLDHIPPATRGTEVFNIYYIKSFAVNGVYFDSPEAIFVQDTASLRKVEGGIDEPIPRVTSHELGHAFSLPHRQDTFNLMASGTTGTSLNESEIHQARESATKRSWIQSARTWQEKAAALETAGKPAEALAVYKRLAALPLEAAPEVQAARLKSEAGKNAHSDAPAK